MVLDSAWLLTQEQQDLPTVKPNASLNVKFDPQTTKLTWDCRENASSGECVLIHKEKGLIKKKVKDSEVSAAPGKDKDMRRSGLN